MLFVGQKVHLKHLLVTDTRHSNQHDQERQEIWGEAILDPSCPGKHPDRLDDMIKLFRILQRTVNRGERETFTGNF